MNVLFREEFATLRPGSVHYVLVVQDHPSTPPPFSGQPNVGHIRKAGGTTCGSNEDEWMHVHLQWLVHFKFDGECGVGNTNLRTL